MLIHNALLTGSITLNGSDVSNITGSANYSASFSSRITNNEATGSTLTAASSSFSTRVTGLEASSGSFSTRTTSLEAASGSFSSRTTNIERVYATTGSNTFTAAQVIQGTLTAQTLIVQTVTSSVLFSTGSNKLGNSLSNVQELTGSVGITGSFAVNTNGTEFQVNAGGVNIGNALTDNHIISGSVAINPNGLFVSSSGLVGINNVSPTVALDVTGAGKFSGALTGTSATFSGSVGVGGSVDTYQQMTITASTAYTVLGLYNTAAGSTQRNWSLATNDIAAGDFTIRQSGAAGGNPFAGGGVVRLMVNAAGNVGIGTTSPNTKLQVTGVPATNSDAVYSLILNDSTGYASRLGSGISFGGYYNGTDVSDTFANIKGFKENLTSGDYAGAMSFQTRINGGNPTERMRITSDGNVGIGTSSPNISGGASGSTVLTISATASGRNGIIELKGTRTASGQISSYIRSFSNSGATPGVDLVMYRGTADTDGELAIATSGTERMRITSAGNVGVNTSTNYEFGNAGNRGITLNGNTGAVGYVHLSSNNTSYAFWYAYSAESLLTTFTSIPLLFGTNGTEKMRISANGSIGAGGSTTNIYNASDIRLKQNINPITYGLDIVSMLNPVKFNWVDGFETKENGNNMLGFIAQEVKELIPEAVESFVGSVDLNGTQVENPLRVNEKFIIPVLVKAIQELKAEIDILKQQ